MSGLLDTLVSPFPTAGAIRNKFRRSAWCRDFTPGSVEGSSLRYRFSTFCGMIVSLNYLLAHRKKITAAPFSRTDFIDPSGLRDTHVQGFYYNFIKANHPRLMITREEFNRQVRKIVPGKGSLVKIPDLMTSDVGDQVFEYYELKPDNAGGIYDANVKLEIIQEFMDRNGLTIYTRGQNYNGCQIEICRFSFLDLGVVRATLLCRRDGMGVLLYRIRMEADLDIAPALEKCLAGMIAMAAIEIGAFFAAAEGVGAATGEAMQVFYRVAQPALRVATGAAPAVPAVEPTLEYLQETVYPQVQRLRMALVPPK